MFPIVIGLIYFFLYNPPLGFILLSIFLTLGFFLEKKVKKNTLFILAFLSLVIVVCTFLLGKSSFPSTLFGHDSDLFAFFIGVFSGLYCYTAGYLGVIVAKPLKKRN